MSRFRGRWRTYWPYLGFAAIGIGLALWQGAVLADKVSGTVVHARIDDCRPDPVKGVVVRCTGSWPRGGARTHGVVDGVDIGDIGRTVTARLHGHTAYAHTRIVAPAVFLAVGVLIALGFLGAAWRDAGRT